MLETKELTRYYGSYLALDHLSIRIGDGELHGFVGPNGAGKTTTMRIMATLLAPSGGTVELDGVDLKRNPKKIREMVGYMPDFFGVYDHLKAWEYLDFYARCYGIRGEKRKKMGNQLLDLVGLADKRDEYVNALSRGMKQRLCLAHALIHDPKLLILDEPASGMDPRARADMKNILRVLREMGKTVLISSHILPELAEMCDSLTILDHGKLVFSGTVEALDEKMNGNAPIEIRLLSDGETDAAVHAARQCPGVTGIEQQGPGMLKIKLDGGDEGAAYLLQMLMQEDLHIADFHRMPMNLEKVFMEVTADV